MDWINLALERDKRRALLITVMNLRFPQNAGNFVLAEDLLVSQEGLFSMELFS